MNKEVFIFFFLLLSVSGYSQKNDTDEFVQKHLGQRVQQPPTNVLQRFYDAGMHPEHHELTEVEKKQLDEALQLLPSLHQQVLKDHLASISFLDHMPNNALTSPLEADSGNKRFNITIRAGILNETISQWASKKELSCFLESDSLKLHIEAGERDALIYVLIHEATHVVDAVMDITPHPDAEGRESDRPRFIRGIWQRRNELLPRYPVEILNKTRFKGGQPLALEESEAVYTALSQTPFVSLYATASWHEDLAELLTVYHLTQVLHQPFKITILENGKEKYEYEPAKNKRVKRRFKLLKIFY